MRSLAVAALSFLLSSLAPPVHAVVINKIYVGTLSNPLTSLADLPDGSPDPTTNPGLVSRGNKYVVQVSFDTDDLTTVTAGSRISQTRQFESVALVDAPGGTNTYELFIPSEGYGGVLTQTGQDHFAIGAGYAPTAEIHFFNSCASEATCDAEFRGFEFESNYIRNNSPTTPHAGGDLVFEQVDPDATFSTTVTNNVVNVLDGSLNGLLLNGGHVDVRSEDAVSASGGHAKPGVFFGEAVPVVAEAGTSPIVFDAANLTRTTDAGTELVTDTVVPPSSGTLRSAPSAIDDPTRQADNDLGAGRSDGEDFLTYEWTVDGGTQAGDQTGTRLDRMVETLGVGSPSGSRFVNDPTDRIVDDVNVAVGIAASGLQTTIDTTSWSVEVTEAITGFNDGDSITVSYDNTLPVIDAALATPAAGDAVKFQLAFHDADEDAVNALIADFELLDVEIFLGLVEKTALFADLIANGMQTLSYSTLASEFGAGMHTLKVLLTDRFLRDTSGMIMATIDFEVAVPEPGLAWLGLVGLLGLGVAGRRRS